MVNFNNIYYLKHLNLEILSIFNKSLEIHKEEIISEWIYSKRMDELLKVIDLTPENFRDTFAIKIFDFFLEFTKNQKFSNPCPTGKSFISTYKDNKHIIKIATLICTELKNKMLKFLPHNISEYDILVDLFDINLSLILTEYDNYINNKLKIDKNKIEMMESVSIISKTDKFGKITYLSNPLLKILGFEKKDLIGKTFKLIRHEDVPDRVYKEMWKTLKSGEIWSGRLKNKNNFGNVIIFETTIFPDKNFSDEITGFTAIKHDLTSAVFGEMDGLTQILNRSGFDKLFEKHIDRM